MPKFSVMLPTPGTDGDFEDMSESAGLISEIMPAAEIICRRAREAWAILEVLVEGRLARADAVA